MDLSAIKAYRVERVSDEAQLLVLKEDWTALLREAHDPSIFLTWEWITTWWKHWGSDKQLWVLTIRDRWNRLVGIAPWMLSPQGGVFARLRRLQFIGSGLVTPVHMGIITRRSQEDIMCAALTSYLERHRREWDALDLESVGPRSLLPCCTVRKGRLSRQTVGHSSPVIRLPGTWETYESRLDRHHRQELRRRRRQLERENDGDVVFERVSDVEALREAMDCLVDLSRKRWHGKELSTSFDNKSFVGFHKEMAEIALQQGWLRMFLMKVAGEVIAVQYVYRFGNTYYDYQKAFAPEWTKWAPGSLLMSYTIQEAIREGVREFDLGSGAHDYKMDWAQHVLVDYRFRMGNNWRAYLWMARGALFDHAKIVAKDVLPQPVQHRINKLASARRSA